MKLKEVTMNKATFNHIVMEYGKDILRFCRMITNSMEEGDDNIKG